METLLQETDTVARAHQEVWLSAEQVSIQYQESDRPVVSGVDFQLHAGESVLFLGPSGCGKSTFAMLCAGLIPNVVEASVQGRWSRKERLARPGGVGYVFQDPDSQFCMLTVGDEIAFGLENLRTDPERMEARAGAALARAHLDLGQGGLAANHAIFSGGMKQKLAIASALALGADLLVFDEPTANLDPLSSSRVFAQIAQLHADGQTMIVIEHKFHPLARHMDTVVLFTEHGEIYRQGPTEQVLREEWAWLMAHGVVAPWKTPPVASGEAVSPSLASREATLANSLPTLQSDHPVPVIADSTPGSAVIAVSLQDAVVAYGESIVWAGVSIGVQSGSLTAIVGPNGVGKTTLLQVLAGLQQPTRGTVRILGQTQGRRGRKRVQGVSYCFQNPELQFIYERVADELANRAVQDDVPQAVADLLRTFGLVEVADQSPYALSQGQKRRLSVAAMLREAHDVYCLDEPTFGQDASTQMTIMAQMEQLRHDGKTIIMTTHDMDLVRRYATQVVVLAEGGVVYNGLTEGLFARADIMEQAHLLADVQDVAAVREPGGTDSAPPDALVHPAAPAHPKALAAPAGHATPPPVHRPRRPSPVHRLNPACHLLSIFATVILSLGVHHLTQAALVFALPLVLMLGLGWLHPWRLVKRYAAFVLFYMFYLFTYMAYAKVPPGTTHVVHILWMHADWYGFMEGVVLALRMLGAVGLGMLFLSFTNLTGFASALSQSLRVPPKFSYGLMAGAHFMPLFQSEWRNLRLARRLRGREGSFWVRPATYAIPLLSQAIRMSERVAIAMEARGFIGQAARAASGRTYYRSATVTMWDILYDLGVPVLMVLVLVFAR